MIKVYGSSDDLIEIEGAIREEFYASEERPNLLAFSNGVVLEIGYGTQGLWKISVLKDPWDRVYYLTHATDPDSEFYSDVIEMKEYPSVDGWVQKVDPWVVYGHEWVRIKK